MVETMVHAAALGAGATLVMDAASLARRRLFGTPLPDYGLVGRWVGSFARGRFRHDRIAASPPIAHERAIGWATHYAVGIAFAALLLAVAGPAWTLRPTIAPALAVGLATSLAPLLVMQPAMGAGLASRRMPHPWAARRRTIVTHAIFGLGLWLAGWAASSLHGSCCRPFSMSFS